MQPTERAGHAIELARAAAVSGQELVIAAGGDGTLGEVANGLVGTDTIMAPFPVGTANSFAKELGMPLPTPLNPEERLREIATTLLNGRVHQMDLGYTTNHDGSGRYWLLWAGTGFDGWLVNRIEPRPAWSKKLGVVGYALQGLAHAPQMPPLTAEICVDGRCLTGEYVLITVSNCRLYTGEFVLSPHAYLDDGIFEVWLFRGRGFWRLTNFVWSLWQGKHHRLPTVTRLNGRSVRITTATTFPVQTDGEKAGLTPLTVEIKPGALPLLVPSTAPPDLFTKPGRPL